MRIITTAFLFLVLGLNIYSQNEKEFNKFLIGGDFSYSYSKSVNSQKVNIKSSSTHISPKFGYFIINNFMIGAGIAYENNKVEADDHSSQDNGYYGNQYNRLILFTLFLRYYTPINLFGQLQSGIGSSGYEIIFPENGMLSPFNVEEKYLVYNFSLGIGYSLKLFSHVALEPSVEYALYRYFDSGELKNHSGELNLFLGLEFYF